MASAQRSMGAAMLTLEAIVLFLAGLVLIGAEDVGVGTAVLVGLGFAAACVLAAGMLRRPAGFYLGWAIQVAAIAFGFVVPVMFALGAVFGALWAGAYFLCAKIDRERAEREVLEQQWAAEHGDPAAG
jgi:uncharacterized membrane protein YciS (DUF1049 family)